MNLSEAKNKYKEWLMSRNYRDDTIRTYVSCMNSFGVYLRTHPTDESHSKRVENYLTYRVVQDDIAPSTQNVEMNALVTFYRMLGIELVGINALRAKRRDRIPPILSQDQVRTLIENFPFQCKLIPMILYGCGMRINEALRLRLKDVDIYLEKFTIHEAKGNKERIVAIPQSLLPLVRVQYDKALSQWKVDKYHQFNGVNCGGIEKKYPAYPMSSEWYWIFPADNYSAHPKTYTPMMRHHIMDYTIQRMFESVRTERNLPVYTTPHILRHACLTHMAEDMLRKGFPEQMIKAQLKDISGHVQDETLEGYLHLAAPRNVHVVSPIDSLVQTR